MILTYPPELLPTSEDGQVFVCPDHAGGGRCPKCQPVEKTMTLTTLPESLKPAVEKAAKAIYDILEGPIADQDYTRQMRQWDLALQIADAGLLACLNAAIEAGEAFRGRNLNGEPSIILRMGDKP